jgi:hypothetical protein
MRGQLRAVRSSGSLVCSLAICALAAAALATGGRHLLAATPFTPGNVVVYRIGDGSGSLVNTGNAVFLDEFSPAERWCSQSPCRPLSPDRNAA